MENNLQLFAFEGNQVRTLEIKNEPWFIGKDVAEILGYKNLSAALSQHVDKEDQKALSYKAYRDSCMTLWTDKNDFSNKMVINESGVYSLIFSSALPNAKKFKHWVTSEVLPQIRKTGSYVPSEKQQRLSIMKENSKTKKASLLYKIAMAMNESDLKQNLLAKAASTVTGERILPKMKTKYYSAKEVGEALGISPWRVGNIANNLKLKAEQPDQNEYGKWVNNKSQYSNKEVAQWFYTQKAIEVMNKYNFLDH